MAITTRPFSDERALTATRLMKRVLETSLADYLRSRVIDTTRRLLDEADYPTETRTPIQTQTLRLMVLHLLHNADGSNHPLRRAHNAAAVWVEEYLPTEGDYQNDSDTYKMSGLHEAAREGLRTGISLTGVREVWQHEFGYASEEALREHGDTIEPKLVPLRSQFVRLHRSALLTVLANREGVAPPAEQRLAALIGGIPILPHFNEPLPAASCLTCSTAA